MTCIYMLPKILSFDIYIKIILKHSLKYFSLSGHCFVLSILFKATYRTENELSQKIFHRIGINTSEIIDCVTKSKHLIFYKCLNLHKYKSGEIAISKLVMTHLCMFGKLLPTIVIITVAVKMHGASNLQRYSCS